MRKEIEKIVFDLIAKIATPDKIVRLNKDFLSYRFYWYLHDDKLRDHKQSKNIIFIISNEYAEDNFSNKEIPPDFRPKLTSFLENKIFHLDKISSHTIHEVPLEESWVFS